MRLRQGDSGKPVGAWPKGAGPRRARSRDSHAAARARPLEAECGVRTGPTASRPRSAFSARASRGGRWVGGGRSGGRREARPWKPRNVRSFEVGAWGVGVKGQRSGVADESSRSSPGRKRSARLTSGNAGRDLHPGRSQSLRASLGSAGAAVGLWERGSGSGPGPPR